MFLELHMYFEILSIPKKKITCFQVFISSAVIYELLNIFSF